MAYSKERIAVLMKASAAGQMSFATRGKCLNSKEFFQAKELKSWGEQIKIMEAKKEVQHLHCKEQKEDPVPMLKQKGELISLTEKELPHQKQSTS